MTQKINYWFPTLILDKKIDELTGYNSYLEKKAYDLQEMYREKETVWNCDTYNTLDNYNYKNDTDFIINKLVECCTLEILDFSKEFGVQKKINDIRCIDFWFNISNPGNYQEFHQHANSHFSIIYYVKAPINSGDLVFQNPTSPSDMFPLPIGKNDYNDASYKTCRYSPIESTVIIFRSTLTHMVEKNRSLSDRISIAMNFVIK